MVCDGTRRVVIIKNISSNIVEEAILVLKDRKSDRDKNKNVIITSANISKKTNNNYLIREAEDIINNYVKERDLKGGFIHELNLRPFNPKRKLFTNVIINTVLIASIALLFFLVTKIF